MWLFLIFVAVPIIEIGLFIQVGGFLGLWPTLAIVILTALVGTTLMRAQGMAALKKLQTNIESGGNPADPIANGAFILIAGLLLLTPGFFTDTLGLLLLVPPVRQALIRNVAAKLKLALRLTRQALRAKHNMRPMPFWTEILKWLKTTSTASPEILAGPAQRSERSDCSPCTEVITPLPVFINSSGIRPNGRRK